MIGIRLLAIPLLINLIFAKEFFISFQLSSKNNKLIYEKFNCSSKLTESLGKKRLLFYFPCNETIKKCCYENKELIINRLLKDEIVVSGFDYKNLNTFKTHAKITFLPLTFDIIIKNGYAYFYLKEKK
jgi:hypothetical protein